MLFDAKKCLSRSVPMAKFMKMLEVFKHSVALFAY